MNPHETARVACADHHASQRQDELAEALAVVTEVRPRVIVEIGCDAGGTLYCWRQICDAVYGITLSDNSWRTGGQGYPLDTHGAMVLRGDSRSPSSVAWLKAHLAGRSIDVLHIDGDHSYEGVRADFETYAPLVDGLVLIHDVLNVWDPRVQVPRYWQELSKDQPHQVIASRRHRPVGFGILRVTKGEKHGRQDAGRRPTRRA